MFGANIFSQYVEVDHYWPANETPFKWRFVGGLIVALYFMLDGAFSNLTIILRFKSKLYVSFYVYVFVER